MFYTSYRNARCVKGETRMITNFKKLFTSGVQYINTKTLADGYIKWLNFANAGMLHKGNVYAMNFVFENLPSNKPILEIGSFCGLSTNAMSYLLQKNGRDNKIFTCDKWLFEGADKVKNVGESQISHQQYREFVKSSFIKNVEFFSSDNKPYTIESTSDEFFELWQQNKTTNDVFGRTIQLGGSISFGYIDGNHTYEFTKRDFENLDKYLESGGYVLFDDSSDRDTFGLTKLMKEIINDQHYKLVMKNPNYLFQKIA
jgi:hypothetical protein